jgi:hypothetical protein
MIAASLFAALLSTAAAVAPAQGVNPWALMAERDLRAMHAEVQANHPGSVDALNPDFSKWVDTGLQESLQRAAEAKSFGGYAAAVRYYAAGFRDGHFNVAFHLTPSRVAYPGFTLAHRNGKLIVASAASGDPQLPAIGSELLDCDGTSGQEILARDVLPYTSGPLLAAQTTATAPFLLLDRGYPRVKRAKECRFRSGGGTVTVALRYRDLETSAWQKLAVPASAETPAMRRIANDGVWAPIPSFQGYEPATREWLQKLVDAAPSWRDAPFVVFDLRGNGGGNSDWGRRILRALYGDETMNEIGRFSAGSYVEWRVSPANVEHVRWLAESIAMQSGKESRNYKSMVALGEEMAQALKRKQPLYSPSRGSAVATDTPSTATPLFRGRLIMLTDSVCASASLDFADLARRAPRATHVGQTTSADSVYMENRGTLLPSAAASLNLPTKVYRARPRGHNEPYVPHTAFDGDIANTAAVESWILGLLASTPPRRD